MDLKESNHRTQGQIAKVNQIYIWYETFGDKKNIPLLLIMGGCCQGVLWDRQFCESLANEQFYVIRYDHRDSGLSSCFDYEKHPYNLKDMAQDAVGLLDALGIKKAHLFGVSLGAFLAEIIAEQYSQKVISLLLLSSTCDIRSMNLAFSQKPLEKNILPPPTQKYLDWMFDFMKFSPQTYEEKLAHRMEGWNQLSGYVFPLDAKINRELQEDFLARLRYPQGILNHITLLNTVHSEDIVRLTPSKIRTPTVILQGSEDPLFTPDHGSALSEKIQHSEYILVRGMGHVPSNHFYPLYIEILKKQRRALR